MIYTYISHDFIQYSHGDDPSISIISSSLINLQYPSTAYIKDGFAIKSGKIMVMIHQDP